MASLIGIALGFLIIRWAILRDLAKMKENAFKEACPPHAWRSVGNRMVCAKCKRAPFEGPLDAKGPDYDN